MKNLRMFSLEVSQCDNQKKPALQHFTLTFMYMVILILQCQRLELSPSSETGGGNWTGIGLGPRVYCW